MHLLYLAMLSNRTSIHPPIARTSHVLSSSPSERAPDFYLSEVFDLEALQRKVGHPLLEWKDVKKTPEEGGVEESLGGWSAW